VASVGGRAPHTCPVSIPDSRSSTKASPVNLVAQQAPTWPVVHCRDCGATAGPSTLLRPGLANTALESAKPHQPQGLLQEAYFSGAPETCRYLFPQADGAKV